MVGGATHRTCAACEDGYYRAGWGSAINNECKQIPAGGHQPALPAAGLLAVAASSWHLLAAPGLGAGCANSGPGTGPRSPCRGIILLPSSLPFAGWKESNRTVAAYDRAKIELCNKGEVSSWSGATRTPPNPEACSPCVANTYAPRRGMAACQQCVGGTAPTSSVGSPGFDKCTACEGNTYRPVSSTR